MDGEMHVRRVYNSVVTETHRTGTSIHHARHYQQVPRFRSGWGDAIPLRAKGLIEVITAAQEDGVPIDRADLRFNVTTNPNTVVFLWTERD